MPSPSDAGMAEFADYLSELSRVCPEAADCLVFPDPPPDLPRRQRIDSSHAARWRWHRRFSQRVADVRGGQSRRRAQSSAKYEPDFYHSHGEGTVVGPPPAPITADDYYRALLLSGESEEDARQIADDLAPDADRPGVIWVGDTLLYVALLSSSHDERIREYLRQDPRRMAQELARVRGGLSERSSRPPGDSTQPSDDG